MDSIIKVHTGVAVPAAADTGVVAEPGEGTTKAERPVSPDPLGMEAIPGSRSSATGTMPTDRSSGFQWEEREGMHPHHPEKDPEGKDWEGPRNMGPPRPSRTFSRSFLG